jgi:hypothetical protein
MYVCVRACMCKNGCMHAWMYVCMYATVCYRLMCVCASVCLCFSVHLQVQMIMTYLYASPPSDWNLYASSLHGWHNLYASSLYGWHNLYASSLYGWHNLYASPHIHASRTRVIINVCAPSKFQTPKLHSTGWGKQLRQKYENCRTKATLDLTNAYTQASPVREAAS